MLAPVVSIVYEPRNRNRLPGKLLSQWQGTQPLTVQQEGRRADLGCRALICVWRCCGKVSDFRIRQTRVSQPCSRFQTIALASVSLSFCICKMGIAVPPSEMSYETPMGSRKITFSDLRKYMLSSPLLEETILSQCF